MIAQYVFVNFGQAGRFMINRCELPIFSEALPVLFFALEKASAKKHPEVKQACEEA